MHGGQGLRGFLAFLHGFLGGGHFVLRGFRDLPGDFLELFAGLFVVQSRFVATGAAHFLGGFAGVFFDRFLGAGGQRQFGFLRESFRILRDGLGLFDRFLRLARGLGGLRFLLRGQRGFLAGFLLGGLVGAFFFGFLLDGVRDRIGVVGCGFGVVDQVFGLGDHVLRFLHLVLRPRAGFQFLRGLQGRLRGLLGGGRPRDGGLALILGELAAAFFRGFRGGLRGGRGLLGQGEREPGGFHRLQLRLGTFVLRRLRGHFFDHLVLVLHGPVQFFLRAGQVVLGNLIQLFPHLGIVGQFGLQFLE